MATSRDNLPRLRSGVKSLETSSEISEDDEDDMSRPASSIPPRASPEQVRLDESGHSFSDESGREGARQSPLGGREGWSPGKPSPRPVSAKKTPSRDGLLRPGNEDTRRDMESRGPKTSPRPDAPLKHILGLAIGVIIIAFAMPHIYDSLFRATEPAGIDSPEMMKTFSEEFEWVKLNFTKQKPRLWNTVISQVKRVLSGNAKYPAVIMFAFTEASSETVTCLTNATARAVIRAYHKNYAVPIVTMDRVKSTEYLEGQISDAFKAEQKVAIIENFHSINPVTVVELFHSYCDNENARCKDVTYLITLKVPRETTDADEFLTELWKHELPYDTIGAIISRVANNIVKVVPEQCPETV